MPNRVATYIRKKFKKLINKNTKSRKQEKSIPDMRITSKKENSRVENTVKNSVVSEQLTKPFHLDSSDTIGSEEKVKSGEEVKMQTEITAPARLLKINEEDILDKCCRNEEQGNKVYKQGEKERQERNK